MNLNHGWTRINTDFAARFWSAPALWRFGSSDHSTEKRQRAAAVQDAGADAMFLIRVHLCPSVVD